MTSIQEVSIGQKFNRWEIISEVYYKTFPSGSKAKFVDCVCECGTESSLRLGALTSPTKPSFSCGCYQREMTKLKNTNDLEVGDVFGRLQVLENLGMFYDEGKAARNMTLVVCSCGNSNPFQVRQQALVSGNTKSCGCLQKEVVSELATTHGMSGTTAYYSWQGLKDRCTNPNNSRWERYGERGISYPADWETFVGFWSEMSTGWFEGADIDRIDFDGNYCKENCRWVNRDIGNHNKSKPENCTSSFKGVYYDKERDKWMARINRNSIVYLQKRFETELEAAIAYDNVSEEIYGDRPNKTIRDDSQTT
jgi:hypothetical protein